MAISPGSDIVLEVARAADPAGLRAAAARLEQLAGGAPPTGGTFTDTLERVGARAPLAPHLPFDPALALVRLRSQGDFGARPAQPYEQFEAFVLQTFVQSMLPKDGTALYGNGTAGEIWKSMLAEQLGTQLARAGGIGIAAMLERAHPEAESAEPRASLAGPRDAGPA